MDIHLYLKRAVIFILIFLVFSVDAESINSSEVKSLRIAIIDNNSPLSMRLPDGRPTGLYVEFWQLWSQINHIPVEFFTFSVQQSIQAVKNGDVDFHAGLFISDERRQWALFSKPIHNIETQIFFNPNRKNFVISDDLSGLKIGVIKASYQEDYLTKNYPNAEIIRFEELSDNIISVLNNKTDLLVEEVPPTLAELGKMGLSGVLQLVSKPFVNNDVSALMLKSNVALLETVNLGISKMPIDKIISIERKWLPDLEPFFNKKNIVPLFTPLELNWLEQNNKFILGIDPYWKPFEFVDFEGEHSGISADYIKHIGAKLKVDINIEQTPPWSEVMELIKAGKIDILSAVTITEARKEFLAFSKPYLSFPLVIVTRRDGIFVQSLDQLKNKRVGVPKSSPDEDYITANYPEVIIHTYDTPAQGLAMVENKTIDAFVENMGVISHHLNDKNFKELHVTAVLPKKFEMAVGVRKGLKAMIPMINKALDEIAPEQKIEINNKWLKSEVSSGIDIKSILSWALPIVSILTFIILYMVRSNRRLHHEISERIKFEEALKSAKYQADKSKEESEKARSLAEIANINKGEFLANMSHEIRTPMNAVVGMSLLLQESGLTEEQQKYNSILNESVSSLLVLIDDILDLSKVEAGQMTLDNLDFSIEHLIENISNQIALKIDSNKINLRINIDSNVPKIVVGDSMRLGQVLLNLTNNAAKFTSIGEIAISAETIKQLDDKVILKFSVSDTGIGMTPEQTSKIFGTYSQADSSITRKYGGTGLGLTISKKLCKLMNGDIWVDSNIDKGANFFFTVTLGTTKKDLTNDISSNHSKNKNVETNNPFIQNNQYNRAYSLLKGKHILLVDDNNINLMVAGKILAKFGVLVSRAANGEEAVNKVKESSFDAILMDIQMPVMDGYTATRKIRELSEFRSLPIIAMSANVMADDVKKAYQSGMNAHVGKPLKVELLLDTLIKFL